MNCPARSFVLYVTIATIVGLSPRLARAGGPIGGNGEPIETSRYAIDISQGPVLGGSRLTGLGGAYVAIAEDVDGDLQNPAAPAVRPFYSVDWFDWWLGLGFTFPALNELDYFNTGERGDSTRAPSSFLFLTPALNLQWGTFGVGLTVEAQSYSADAGSLLENTLSTTIVTGHLQFANSFLDGQLIAGLGTRRVVLSLQDEFQLDARDSRFTSSGTGTEVGVLLRPNDQQFRVGASLRSSIETQPRFTSELLPNEEGDLVWENEDGERFYYPSSVSLPWDANLGVAYQFGRPLNPRWRAPRDMAKKRELQLSLARIEIDEAHERDLATAATPQERDRIEQCYQQAVSDNDKEMELVLRTARLALSRELAEMQRFYVLLTGSVVITGVSKDAVGIESYFDQVVRRSGQKATFSPRFGMETEAVPDFLKLRVGGYLEAARAANATHRGHFTFGVDFRLFRYDVFGLWPADYLWRIGLVADIAPRYATWGISLGGWYPRHRPEDLPPLSSDAALSN